MIDYPNAVAGDIIIYDYRPFRFNGKEWQEWPIEFIGEWLILMGLDPDKGPPQILTP